MRTIQTFQKRYENNQKSVFHILDSIGNADLLLVNCFLRPGFLEAEGPRKVAAAGGGLEDLMESQTAAGSRH